MSKKKLKQFRVTRIDESFAYVDATSEKEALRLAEDTTKVQWQVWIGDPEAKEVKQ